MEPEIQTRPERIFAFIDKSNIDRTTKDLLGFRIDWQRLCDHLKNERPVGRSWMCEKVFIYVGTLERKVGRMTAKHTQEGYEARIRSSKPQQEKVREYPYTCVCGIEDKVVVTTAGAIKSNCDVGLTVDAMQFLDEATDILLFSGDGDFEPLILHAIERGIIVHIVSNTRRDAAGNKVFSTRLRDLIIEEEVNGKKRIRFIDINDWKRSIEKQPHY